MKHYNCAKCAFKGCKVGDMEKTLPNCPSLEKENQEQIAALYMEEENYKIAHNAALVEAEGYCQNTRMEEILLFLKKMEYKKIGLIFCMGLQKEAKEVQKILEYHGFEVVSVGCKNGMIPKSHIGIEEHQKIKICPDEIMCNPIGQAMLMNQEQTEFNIMLGLCVGHDTLCLKYLEKPVTILAVKDRVTGHNPLAPIYMADGYYHKKLYGDK